jgi:RND family efflux transporter MFP subunit
MRRNHRSRIVLSFATLALTVAACVDKAPPAATPAGSALKSMMVQPVRTPLERSVDGTIEAVNQATVSAQTSGRIAEILYDVNDVVPAGAVIIRLKGTEQRAGLQAAQASVTEARARNTEAATQYQRIADMYQRRVVSKSQFDQAAANKDAAAARLAAAEAGATSAHEGVGYTEIRAPYGGVVTKRLVQVGETVGPGTPLMTGLSLKDLRVNFNIPQSIVGQVRQFKKAAVYVGSKRIESDKITIFPEAATPSSTFRARVDLPSGAVDVAPGMYVKVGLMIGEADRLVIPVSAVVERSEVSGVYVIGAQGNAELRYVRKGHQLGENVEILAGLAAGDKVALDPIAASASVVAAQP